MPKVSIILPTFNGSKYISQSIESVLNQSYQGWEFLVIDDCSTDNVGEIIKKYANQDKRIQYIRNPQNLKLAKTLNKGIKLAKGKYIARIDDDDVWIDSEKLKKQVEFLDKNGEYVLIGTAYKITDDKGKKRNSFCPPLDNQKIRKVILQYNPFGHSTVLFKKEVALKINGYNEKMPYAEDYDFWLRMGTKGKFANLESESVLYLLNTKGMSAQNTKIREIKFRLKMIKKYWKDYPKVGNAILSLVKYTIQG